MLVQLLASPPVYPALPLPAPVTGEETQPWTSTAPLLGVNSYLGSRACYAPVPPQELDLYSSLLLTATPFSPDFFCPPSCRAERPVQPLRGLNTWSRGEGLQSSRKYPCARGQTASNTNKKHRVEAPQNIKNWIPTWPSNSASRYRHERIKSSVLKRCLCTYVHSSTINNNQHVEAAHEPTDGWKNKQNVAST